MDQVNKVGKDPIEEVSIPKVVGCKTKEIIEPLRRWRRAHPGVQPSWLLKQALWDLLQRQGFTGKRDKKPV
jgi:hypothetical protein